jgi:hypothetical protein
MKTGRSLTAQCSTWYWWGSLVKIKDERKEIREICETCGKDNQIWGQFVENY